MYYAHTLARCRNVAARNHRFAARQSNAVTVVAAAAAGDDDDADNDDNDNGYRLMTRPHRRLNACLPRGAAASI